MLCNDMRDICEKVEKLAKSDDFSKIEEIWPVFLADSKSLFVCLVKIYLRIFPDEKPAGNSFWDAIKIISSSSK